MLFVYSAQIGPVLQRGLSFKLVVVQAHKYSGEARANHVPNCSHLRNYGSFGRELRVHASSGGDVGS